MAGITRMIDEYSKGFDADLHWRTASGVYGLDFDLKLSKQDSEDYKTFKTYRQKGKPINFGAGYGQQAKGFQTNIRKEGLMWTLEECQQALDGFFATYPEYKDYQLGIQQFFINSWFDKQENIYLETMFGRKRWFSITEKQRQKLLGLDKFGQPFAFVNDAINHPIQGTAADVVKRAMVKAVELIQKEKYDANIILQVHDELVVDCAIRHLNDVAELVGQKAMIDYNQPYFKNVPLITDVSVGVSWGECVEVDHFIGSPGD